MFRRLFWLVSGAGFGFGASLWVARAVRQAADRFRPERVRSDLGSAILQLGRDVQAAAGEGLAAMREEEAQIRREIGDPVRRRAAGAIPVGEVEPEERDGRQERDDRRERRDARDHHDRRDRHDPLHGAAGAARGRPGAGSPRRRRRP